MGKRVWDGTFETSRYVETGNMINDVIENSGRLLHEATSDGGTHEIVDRGAYISEDYYFPNEKSRKKHIHYEFRSTGEILIDGKVINQSGEDSAMKYGKSRSLDAAVIEKEAGDHINEGSRLHELGEQFVTDKESLQRQIENVRNSELAEKDKNRIIAQLEAALENAVKEYEASVAEEEKKVQEELKEQIDIMQEAADKLEEQATELRSVKMEAASMDASGAAEVADEEKRNFERMKAEYAEKLDLQMQEADIRRQKMHSRRYGGF